jgi:hypothetical protein
MSKKKVSSEITICAIVAIVAIVFIVSVFNQNITGNVTLRTDQNCVDTDVNNDNSKFGTVTIQTRNGPEEWSDECVADKTLVQYYCRGGQGYGKIGRHCPNGCLDGVCLSNELVIDDNSGSRRGIVVSSSNTGREACTDNEKPDNRYEQGTLIFKDFSGTYEFKDYCRGKVVIQYSCTTANSYRSIGSLCLKGCSQGACTR